MPLICDFMMDDRRRNRSWANIGIIIVIFQLLNFSSADLPRFVKSQYPPECRSECSVMVKNETSDVQESVGCQFIKDTFECEKRTRILSMGNRSMDQSPEFSDLSNQSCQLDRIRVGLVPHIYDHPFFVATLSLNVTLTILDQSTRAAAIRLICLESGPEPEFYCVNKTRPLHWGDQFYWPCRLFDFSNVPSSTPVVFPVQFHNDCFRLTGLSIFMINVTLYPQNCVASHVFRMPTLQSVEAKDVVHWMPLVTVDTNPEDGVWISLSSPPSKIRVRRMAVELYEILVNGQDETALSQVLRRRSVITAPDDTVFFKDLPRARYVASAYAEHSSCVDDKCLAMHVPFNLTKDHYTRYTQKVIDEKMRLESAWVPVTAAIGGLIVAFLVIAASVMVYLRWKAGKRKRRQSPVQFVQFTRRPVVLILYTNDFAQHRRCVLDLASYLQTRANCDVELDEWALSSTASGYRTPMEWLMHALQRADYFLMVFSAGAKETIFRPVDSAPIVELRSERPWDETFAPAMHFILQRILQTARNVDATVISRDNRSRSSSAFNRYVCLYFSYSSIDLVPDLFRTLPCPKFQLPSELRHLVCHVHELPHESIYEHCPMDAERLESSIADASAFVQFNPDWLQSRLVERSADEKATSELSERQRINEISSAIDRLRGPAANEAPENVDEFYAAAMQDHNRALESQRVAEVPNAAMYPLLPPPENAQGEAAEGDSRFELLPPDDDELTDMFYSNSNSNRSHPPA